ncbi:MAG: YggT family protein [Halothiobacillaceae bacterium]
MDGYFANPLILVIQTLFQLYIWVVLLRYFLQLFRADFYNPLTQLVVKATNPLLIPLRGVVPPVGRHDLASIVLALLLIAVMVVAVSAVGNMPITGSSVFGATLYFAFKIVTDLFFWTVLIRALLSWFGQQRTPVSGLLEDLTDPILRPVQNILPPLGGIDLSPLAVLLGIQVIQMLVLPLIGKLIH